MPEPKPEISSNNVGERRLSRRNFLKLVGLGVGVGIVGRVTLDNLIVHPKNKPLNGEATNAPYSEQVEKMFSIKLSEEPSTDWSEPGILMLGEFLSHLPSHFYSPHNGSVLEIELTRGLKGGEAGGAYYPDTDRVTLRHVFTPGLDSAADYNLSSAQNALTHELAHRVDFSKNQVADEKIQAIIGEDFDNFKKDAYAKSSDEFFKLFDTRKKDDPELDEVTFLAGRLAYGLTSIIELVAVLSEIYTWGKEKFNKLGNWMGVERVKGFYDVIKTDIFDGKEYQNHDEVMGNFTLDPTTGQIISAGFLK